MFKIEKLKQLEIMKIKKVLSLSRRDFYADMECESCGHVEKSVSCYDDSYFHRQVIPAMKCAKCGEVSKSGATSRPTHPDHVTL